MHQIIFTSYLLLPRPYPGSLLPGPPSRVKILGPFRDDPSTVNLFLTSDSPSFIRHRTDVFSLPFPIPKSSKVVPNRPSGHTDLVSLPNSTQLSHTSLLQPVHSSPPGSAGQDPQEEVRTRPPTQVPFRVRVLGTFSGLSRGRAPTVLDQGGDDIGVRDSYAVPDSPGHPSTSRPSALDPLRREPLGPSDRLSRDIRPSRHRFCRRGFPTSTPSLSGGTGESPDFPLGILRYHLFVSHKSRLGRHVNP